MIDKLNDTSINFYTLVVTVIPIIVSAIYGCMKIYKSIEKKKKNYPSSSRPEIKYFTNREEITKEIFDTMYQTDRGEVFTIYGPAGIGKSEFARLINLISNPSVYHNNNSLNIFVKQQYSATIEKKSQSYIFDAINSDLTELFKQIYESFGLDYYQNKRFEVISEDLLKKTSRLKQVLFIFENISDNEFASQIYEFFKTIDSKSKKTKFFFFCVYSSNLRPELANTSIKKELKKLSVDQTKEFFIKHDLNFNDKYIEKIYKLTNGNLTLLKTVTKIIHSNSKTEVGDIVNSKDIATLFINHLKNDTQAEEVFIAFLSLSISHDEIDKFNVSEILSNKKDYSLPIERLVNSGFLEVNRKHHNLYSISSKLCPILYTHWYIEIIRNQDCINSLISNGNPMIEDCRYVHLLFDFNSSHKIVNELKKCHSEKKYNLALKIFNLIDSSSDIAKYLQERNPKFEDILYYVLEGLIGAGNYSNAAKIIDDPSYCEWFNMRNKSITASNFQHHFLQGNLYHLQNKYEDALNVYQAILQSEVVEKNVFYQVKVLWGLAHVNRHLGYLENANNLYTKAINKYHGTEKKILEILVKCMNEQNSIFMYTGKPPIHPFNSIDSILKKIKNTPSELSTNKYKAIYFTIKKDYPQALRLIDDTLVIYEKNMERLRFNLYFEKAEILRKKNDNPAAICFYKKSLESSEYNGDKNIQLYSLLGILCCELKQNEFYVHFDRDEQLNTLFKCKELCYNNDEICFNLGLKHVRTIKQVFDGIKNVNCLESLILPLF